MRTTEQGITAEKAVADLLKQHGYKVIARNWKTKSCEIDIVSSKGKIVYFIEVKYRSSSAQGSGFEYITDRKLKRMSFAAEVWKQVYHWDGDYRLMAAAVSGENCQDINIIELD